MNVDPHVAIAVVTTLGAGWLMISAGIEKHQIERRHRRRVCPSCGREIAARVCATCAR